MSFFLVACVYLTISLSVVLFCHVKRYGDGAGNTVEENSSVFSIV